MPRKKCIELCSHNAAHANTTQYVADGAATEWHPYTDKKQKHGRNGYGIA